MNLRLPISYTTAFLSKISILSKATLFVFVLGFSWGLQAQTTDNYPVQTTAYCAAPFSQRLSDYFSSDKRLIVNLLLKDLTKPSVQVYLRWQLEGPGIRIGSRDGFVPASFISLQPGVPSKLSGADLAGAYFFPAALQAEGMDVVDAYNLSLPEGFYTISVQAFEASTGQVVSNTSVTFLVLTSPQPPILNLPAIGSQISATSLQKVLFQWTPRHFATAESQVVYQLKVCQVPDDSEPNEQIMLSCTEPRLDLTVPNTTLTGDITQWIKPLEVGQRYGVQVRAIDLAGQLNNFSNEGYSQVHWFRYGQPCVPPIFSIKSVSSDRVQLQWQALAQAQSYLVEYQAEGDVSWTTLKTTATTQVVSELLSRQTYLFRMRTDCGSLLPSEASEVQRWNIAEESPEPSPQLPIELLNPELIKVQTSGGVAQTPTSLPDLYHNFPVSNSAQLRIAAFSAPTTTTLQIPDCALASGSFADCQRPHPSVGLPTGGEELGSLKVGDVLGIYDFAVFVTKVKSGLGLAGEGLVRLPFLGNAMTLVEFEGVKAKKAQPSDNGGCVYEVSGFFRVKDNVTAQELAQQQQSLVERLLKESDPTVFAGTFEQALTLYDQTVAKLGTQSLTSVQAQPLLIQYLGAILQGSEQLKQQLSELGSSNPAVVTLLGDLQKLMDGLQSQLTTLKTTSQTPTVAGLEVQYEAIFERIKQLGHTPEVPIETPQSGQLSNVEVSKVSFNSAHLSWQGSGSIKRYAVVYQIPTLGELTLNTTDSQVELSNLQAGSNYTFRVIGYGADGQVLDSYGPALFATPAKTLPAPENLTYTVLDDHSVKISWAKNSLHQRFKLSYQDANGETRTLYPSTNSAIIQGLTPDQLYLYDIVAYGTVGSENIASTATTSDFKLGESCDVSIKKTNSFSHLVALPNRTYLLAEGCSSGKISWDNGSGEAKEEGEQLKWPDGEVASSQRLQIRTIYWVVAPERAKTYTAICRLSSGKICSASQDVTPSLPACPSVSIRASANSAPKGGSISLSVSGCEGQWQWARGLGTSSSVTLVLQAPVSMWGECHTNGQVCVSNTVFLGVEEMSCLQEVWINSQSAQKTGTNLGVVCIGCGTVGQATLQASGCENGKLSWEIQEGQATGQVNAYNPGVYQLSSIKNDVIVKVSCTQADGTSCPVQTISVPKPTLECNDFALDWRTDSENYPHKFQIYGLNQQPFLLTDAQGLALNTYARLQVNVPFSSQEHLYKASFPTEDPAKNACQAALLVPAVTYQIDWAMSPYYPSFKSGVDEFDATNLLNQTSYQVTLEVDATTKRDGGLRQVGSCPGQLIWSNDQDNTTWEAQRLILRNNYTVPDSKTTIYRPLPRVTTMYWAVCVWKGVTYPVSNPKKIIIGSNNCFRIDPSAFQVSLGGSVKLRAVGCSGSVAWKQNGQSIGQGELLVHTPQPKTTPTGSSAVVVSYEAFCATLNCTQTFSVNITPCRFGVTTPKSLVKIAEPVQLSVEGCEGGNVEWNTGESGRVLQVAPLQTTSYWATCWVNGVVLCRSNEVSLEVEQAAPLDVVCPSFSIAASSTKVTRCVGSKIKFTPTCQGGDRIVWDNTTTLDASTPYEIEVKGAQTIKATCHTPYGMSVTQQVEIRQEEPVPTVAPTEVYAGFPTILRATGCYNSDCKEGTYEWKNLKNGISYHGSSISVQLTEATDFEVQCTGGKAQKVTVKLKEVCEEDYKSPGITSGRSTLKLDKTCNSDYSIFWYKEEYFGSVKRTLIAKNVKSLTVDLPICNINGGVTHYRAICVKNDGIPCATIFKTACIANSYGTLSPSEPTTPDPCNEFAFAEKGGAIASPRSTQKTYVLYSDWCVGSKVEWYLDGTKIATLSPPNGQVIVDNPKATYEYYCYLSGGVVCRNEYKLPSSSGQLSGGRIAAEDVLTAAASDCPPEAKVDLAVAMQAYLQQMLCQSIYLYQGDPAKAQAFLEQLLASLLSNPNFAGQNLSFPTDMSAVIAALTGGDCKQAAQLLTQNLGGTVSFQEFNAIKNGSYSYTLEQLVPKDICDNDAPPVIQDGITNGRVAYTIDPNRYFIAPDGRPIKLPSGAIPKFFVFSFSWAPPPVGTLGGFQTADGALYFAEITSGSQEFKGYRKIAIPFCPAQYYSNSLFVSVPAGGIGPVYYLEEFSENGQCGIKWTESTYKFAPTPGQTVSLPLLSGSATIRTSFSQCPESTQEYISVGSLKLYKDVSLTGEEKNQWELLLGALNGRFGGRGSVSIVEGKDLNNAQLQKEAQSKGVREYVPPGGRMQLGTRFVLLFYGEGQLSDCELASVNKNMEALQKSTVYKYSFIGATQWFDRFFELTPAASAELMQRIRLGVATDGFGESLSQLAQKMLTTAAFFYYGSFAKLGCVVDESRYYVAAGTNADGSTIWQTTGNGGCGEAFAAGAIHSLIEDLDVVSLLVGVSELVKEAVSGNVQTWRDYPDELKSFQETLKTDPAELTLSDFKKILPPPIKNNQQAIEKAYQAGLFFYNYYGTDANCWRSGELTAMIAPAIITVGGSLGPKMVSRLVGRLSKKVATDGKLLDIVSLFRQGRKIDYDDIGEIQQVIIRNEDEIDGIYEKVGDELVPICGFTPTGGRVSSSRRCPKIRFTGEALAELSTRLGSKLDEMVDILDKLTPRASHTLKLENGKLKLVDADGVEWVEDITGTQVIAKGGNKPFNKFLNGFPPLKNFEYVIDGNFKYKTDELGRVEKITIENLELNPNRVRDEYQQGLTKGLKDGKPTDNGGHMAGNQFNGPSEQINYHSQDWVSNQSGDWYKMEQELKQLRLDNPNVTIKVEIVPEFSGTSKRPDRFDVEVKMNGTIFKEFDIPNP